ncbi:hypothetical protein DRQ50_12155 [bacterium]|nr:MAG: hypothetical protein DRQ50_12155 [bacterium]
MQLEEQWRVGGEDGEDFFGLITQLVVADDGTIYLLDTRLGEVPVYSTDGERIDTLSREGDGPGETRFPVHILFMPDGSLGIAQTFPGRIVTVGLDGTPAGNIEFGDKTEGGFLRLLDCATQNDRLVISGEKISQNPPTGQVRTSFAAAYGVDGQEQIVYESYTRELDFTKFHWAEDEIQQVDFRKMAVGRDNRVYVAGERNRYIVRVYQPDGTLDRIITREYAHRERTQEEIDRIETTLEVQLAQLPGATWDISKTEPDISTVKIGPDGNLWVECSMGGIEQPEGVFYTWDVFSPDGHFIEQVAAHCEGDGDEDLMLWTKTSAIQITGFKSALQSLQGGGGAAEEEDEEAEPMEVIYYQVSGS